MARGARSCQPTLSTRSAGPGPRLPPYHGTQEDAMQNAIPELRESPFLHCPLRPGEKLEHSAHNWNSKLQSPPTDHKQVLVCRRLSKAGAVGIWALLPTRSYTRCGWIHDRSRRPRGNADVKCSPRARWLRSVVCQRCPERAQRNAECKPAVPGARPC